MAQSSDRFFLEGVSATVRTELQRRANNDGVPFGELINGEYNRLSIGQVLDITNVLGDTVYFYPRISNLTDKDCIISIGCISATESTGAPKSTYTANGSAR